MRKIIDKVPGWLSAVASALFMVIAFTFAFGGEVKQLEINTINIEVLEKDNKSDHGRMMEDINQLKVDVGIIKDWVMEQKKKDN